MPLVYAVDISIPDYLKTDIFEQRFLLEGPLSKANVLKVIAKIDKQNLGGLQMLVDLLNSTVTEEDLVTLQVINYPKTPTFKLSWQLHPLRKINFA